MIRNTVLRSSALGLLLALAPALTHAETRRPQIQPQDFAPAVQRNSAIRSVYEVLGVPELNAVFYASVPDFKDDAPGDIYMLSADNLSEIRRIQLQRKPFALAIDHKRGWLYAGNTKDGSLSVIDARSGLFLRTIQLGKPGKNDKMEHTRMIEIDEETGRVFVTGPTDEGIFWIVDGPSGEVISRHDEVVIWAAGLARDNDGKIYVGGGGAEEIVVMDAATGERLRTFSTGNTEPGQGFNSTHFFVNLSIDVAGGRLFAVDSHRGELWVFDTASGKALATVPIGPAALDVEYNPTRNEAYVTYFGTTRDDKTQSGGLVVVNGADYSVAKDLALETFPSNLSLDVEGQVLFASVGQPVNEAHPNYRPNALSGIVRVDLDVLGNLAAPAQ